MEKQAQFRDVRKVRVVGRYRPDAPDTESEVNEALSLGWILLSVQQGESKPVFVIGWTSDEEAPKTDWQKRIEEDFAAMPIFDPLEK